MFTGIITDLGRLRSVERASSGDTRFVLATNYDTERIALGASIACSGACLTVVERGPGWFAAEASAETLSCTTLGGWRPGRAVNLEQSLRLGDELGGHLVSGHVDGVARLDRIEPEGGSLRFTVAAPPELARFVAAKGSVALDGVSLTVNEVDGARFGVNIIDHTRRATSFGEAKPGDPLNMEIDLLARYVARLMAGS
ncbi:MAG TPA: riboflavin synthase [Alphaproteobacteria bacterium]|nr:riboflavin synthase [Alphaproteobacteria bacterium]